MISSLYIILIGDFQEKPTETIASGSISPGIVYRYLKYYCDNNYHRGKEA